VRGWRVSLAYTSDSRWRNRSQFINGRPEIVAFLTDKWHREHEYRLIKELWAYAGDRIAVRFCYEWHDDAGQWYRAYGNENWQFDADGFMAERHASINDVPIDEADRRFRWDRSGPRPQDHPASATSACKPGVREHARRRYADASGRRGREWSGRAGAEAVQERATGPGVGGDDPCW
jgi:hypothetical protein